MTGESLQQQYGVRGVCFGCGPLNDKGLQINSFVEDDRVVATFQPQPGHEGFAGMMNGGIISALLDCHSNWTAAWHIMTEKKLVEPESTVTGGFTIKFLKPTPMDKPVTLVAKVVSSTEKKAVVQSTLLYDGDPTAEFEGAFLVVKEGHPAYNQWNPDSHIPIS